MPSSMPLEFVTVSVCLDSPQIRMWARWLKSTAVPERVSNPIWPPTRHKRSAVLIGQMERGDCVSHSGATSPALVTRHRPLVTHHRPLLLSYTHLPSYLPLPHTKIYIIFS